MGANGSLYASVTLCVCYISEGKGSLLLLYQLVRPVLTGRAGNIFT